MNLVPKLRKEKKVVNIHQDVLIDEYAWIKQKDWQSVLKDPSKLNKEVLKYINEENNYKSEKLKNLDAFKKIFEELKVELKIKTHLYQLKMVNFLTTVNILKTQSILSSLDSIKKIMRKLFLMQI